MTTTNLVQLVTHHEEIAAERRHKKAYTRFQRMN